jgi:hypothetical protein
VIGAAAEYHNAMIDKSLRQIVVRTLPTDATDESRRRHEIARRLAESCPAELGAEIAVTGSVALGLADESSDVELNLWCDALPTVAQRAAWIASVGGEPRSNREEPWTDGTLEATFCVDGVWIEAGWMTKARLEETLRGILAASVLGHNRLQMAWIVECAVDLRTTGRLARWRSELAAYPEPLREKLIEANTHVWQLPHAMAGRWTYCRRSQPLALTERLTWDTYNLLGLVFAINRRWEPDWKWLREVTRDLPLAPMRMADRIERVFTAPTLEERVRTDLELIRDALALAPTSAGIEQARATIRECLAQSDESR